MKKRHPVKDFILYGGVSKEDYREIQPMLYEENLKVWKIISIILALAAMGLLLFTQIWPDYFSSSYKEDGVVIEIIKNADKKFAIAYAILAAYCTLLAFLLWTIIPKFPKISRPLIIFSNFVILLFFASVETTLLPEQLSIVFITLLLASSLLTVRTPLQSFGLLSFTTTYFLLFVIFQEKTRYNSTIAGTEIADWIWRQDISYGVVFSVLSICFGNFINCIRIRNLTLRVFIEKQRDIDSLTGAKSKTAYDHEVQLIMERLYQNSTCEPFALAIFDVNGLKITNDTYGHELGDELLIRSAQLINEYFKNSTVYRIGGDEFAVIIRGLDYENRNEIVRKFRARVSDIHEDSKSLLEDAPVACGMATYDENNDVDFISVFSRADTIMYDDKRMLKSRNNFLKKSRDEE